jgi:uncharacterized CHY-type Zn-finger protein
MATSAPVITCPRCDKKFKGKPELYGKRIKCPGCEKPFVVPSPDAKIDEKALKEVVEVKEERPRMILEDEGPNEYTLTHYEDLPRCPNCANPLENADAVVCLFCGYNTSTRTWGKTKRAIETTSHDRLMWLMPGIICVGVIFLQVIGCLYYCLVLPNQLGDGWKWLSHESLKMWFVILSLFDMWPLGYFAYLRLVMNPSPQEREYD